MFPSLHSSAERRRLAVVGGGGTAAHRLADDAAAVPFARIICKSGTQLRKVRRGEPLFSQNGSPVALSGDEQEPMQEGDEEHGVFDGELDADHVAEFQSPITIIATSSRARTIASSRCRFASFASGRRRTRTRNFNESNGRTRPGIMLPRLCTLPILYHIHYAIISRRLARFADFAHASVSIMSLFNCVQLNFDH